jgi:hypothetical protein
MRGRILVLGGAGLAGLLLWAATGALVAPPLPITRVSGPQLAPARGAATAATPSAGQTPAAPRLLQAADIVDSLDPTVPVAAPTNPPSPPPVPTDPPSPLPAPTVDPYRQWIHEAHQQYSYPESEEQMYQLLLCESSGNPAADSPDGLYHGLFQYSAETWGGDWNPYRNESIYDAQAQIWATTCAWSLGMQQQWGCYSTLYP